MLVTFCLCGCSEINFMTYHNADGTIHEYVYISIDSQKLTNYGYNIDEVKLTIQTDSRAEANNLLTEFQNKAYTQLINQQLTNKEYTLLYNGVKVIEQNWNGDTYLIGLEYSNSTTYKQFYEILSGQTSTSKTKTIKKTFYTKTYYYGTASYGDFTIFGRIYNYYSNSVFATISPQETKLKYSYSVSSRRLHSDAENITLDTNGNYIHSWNISPDNPSRQIYFYTISANRSIWIITSIIIGLTTCLILCSIGIVKTLINKHKNINKNN